MTFVYLRSLSRPLARTMSTGSIPARPAFVPSILPSVSSSTSSSFVRASRAALLPERLVWRVPAVRRGYACVASSPSLSGGNGLMRDETPGARGASDASLADVGFDEAGVTGPELDILADDGFKFDKDAAAVAAPNASEEGKDDGGAETSGVKKEVEKAPEGMGPLVESFRLSPETVRRLAKNGIKYTTEVQAGTFDLLFDGKDLIAKSRTGTGKTLAFALPIMERLAIIRKERGGPKPRGEGPGCIVLAPTRELAKQVAREMTYLGEGLGLSVECFYGGVAYGPQEGALRRGVDVVVGTPGRIMDHMDKGNLRLDNISFAVLDEADEMLSMGFAQDVETVFETLPPESERQVILFSATVPSWVKKLASQYQKKDVVTFDSVTTGSMAATTVRHCAVRVPERDEARAALLADIIAVHSRTSSDEATKLGPSRAIVFTQTKREADELATSGALDGCGAAVLHGDVSQNQREVTLSQFRQGQFQVLVATDVAARGLDISGVDVVVQYRVPRDSDAYIHRAGRTGRAGKSGTAVVMYNDRESRSLRSLERECRIRFVQESAPAPETALEAAVEMAMGNVPSVDNRVIKHLLPRAELLLNGGDENVQTLAALLAIAGRRTRLEDRSILSGEKGMRTVVVTGNRELNPGLAIRFIRDLARTVDLDTRVGLVRVCRDGSTVADVPSGAVDGLLAASASLGEDAELKLGVALGVPALRDTDSRRPGGRYNDRGGGGRYNDRGGGGRFNDRGGGGRYGDRRGSMNGGGGGGARYNRYDDRSSGGRSRGSFRSDRGSDRGEGGGDRGGAGGYRRDRYDGDRRSGYSSRSGGYSSGRSSGGSSGGNFRGGGGSRRAADFLSDDF